MKSHVGFLLFSCLFVAHTNAMYEGTLIIYGSTADLNSECNFVASNSSFTWRHLQVQLPDETTEHDGLSWNFAKDEYVQPYNETIAFVNLTFTSPESNPTIRWVINDEVFWHSEDFGVGYNESETGFGYCSVSDNFTNFTAGKVTVTMNYTAISSGSVFFSLMVPFVSFAAALGAILM
jgi:hypothetical protein